MMLNPGVTSRLPSGRVTFAFTDVVGSTTAFTRFGEEYVAALRRMHDTIAATAVRHGGVVVSTEGDGAFLAFGTAGSAIDALCELQRGFEGADEDGLALRIRAGAHAGDARPIGDEYVSLVVHHAARVAATAGAGQVIVSEHVQDELDRPRGERLGAFALKDIPEPVVLWRVTGDSSPPRATPALRTNVAAPRTAFIGRTVDLAELRELLAVPGPVTITGPGGLGKSRLAAEFAHAAVDEWAGGIWLAELAPVHSADQLADAVAAVLGVESRGLAAELQRRGELVLVLDGCEHLVDAVAELVEELLASSPQLRVLCTSREPLEVADERVLRLRPLGTDGERLFVDRAEAAGAAVDPADLPTVARICRQLDGLPLALELAAARTPNLPLADLAAALEAGELQLRRRSGPRHQRNLHDLVDWSLDRLDPGERAALLALSVFPGRFAADDARSLLADVPGADAAALPELVRRSLVDLDGDRFRLLLVIRDVARAELHGSPDADEAAHRALVQWALRGCPPPNVRGTPGADDFDTAVAVEAALRWGLAAGLPELYPLMRRLRTWSQETGGSAGVRDLARLVIDRPLPETVDEVMLQSMACETTTGMGWTAPEQAGVAERVRELVRLARLDGGIRVRYETTSTAALVVSKCGATAEALGLEAEALGLTAVDPALRTWRGTEMGNLALMHYVAGDLHEAERWMRLALAAAEEEDDRTNVAVNHCNLAELLLDRGEAGAAEDEARAALRTARGVRTPSIVALALLVEALAAGGAVDDARELAGEALPALEQLAAGDPSMGAQLDRLRGAIDDLPPLLIKGGGRPDLP